MSITLAVHSKTHPTVTLKNIDKCEKNVSKLESQNIKNINNSKILFTTAMTLAGTAMALGLGLLITTLIVPTISFPLIMVGAVALIALTIATVLALPTLAAMRHYEKKIVNSSDRFEQPNTTPEPVPDLAQTSLWREGIRFKLNINEMKKKLNNFYGLSPNEILNLDQMSNLETLSVDECNHLLNQLIVQVETHHKNTDIEQEILHQMVFFYNTRIMAFDSVPMIQNAHLKIEQFISNKNLLEFFHFPGLIESKESRCKYGKIKYDEFLKKQSISRLNFEKEEEEEDIDEIAAL